MLEIPYREIWRGFITGYGLEQGKIEGWSVIALQPVRLLLI